MYVLCYRYHICSEIKLCVTTQQGLDRAVIHHVRPVFNAVPFVNDEQPQHPQPAVAAEDDDYLPSTTVEVDSVTTATDEDNSDME